MRILFFCFFSLLFQHSAFSQKEWSNWFYDGKNQITFKNGYPENVTNFIPNPPPVPPFENILHFYYRGNQGISYSDPSTGDLKFIISNRSGFGKDFNIFPNDTLLRSCPPNKNSYRIIPFPGNSNKFYVLQFQSNHADLLAAEMGLQVLCPNAIGLGYSIIDLSLNGGLGDFISVNNVIKTNLTEQTTLVKHKNGQDTWVLIHPYNTGQFNAYLINNLGVQLPVVSTIGAMISGGSNFVRGVLEASHDGKILAGCRSLSGSSGNQSDIELFDFDNETGLLSNYRSMPSGDHISRLCFSPDNTKLYGSGSDINYSTSIVNQWDFSIIDIANSKTRVVSIPQGNIFDMQLALDGKIYLNFNRIYGGNGVDTTYLPAIQCPNLPKYACNLNLKAFEIPLGVAFPALINDFINEPPAVPPPTFSIGNDTTVCFGSLTITAPAGWESYRWSTGENTRAITVNTEGIYYVLTGNTGFSCPEGYGFIKVTDAAEKLNLGKDTVLCQGVPYVINIPSQYTNILWNNGSNARDSLVLGSGTIIISALDNKGCFTKDTIVIGRKFYPNAIFGPADTTLCGNETLLLKLLPPKSPFFNAQYIWQNNSTLDTFRVTQPGTYWGSVAFDGCTASDTITVQYISGDGFSLGADTSLCAGDSLLITAPVNNASYLWNTGATTQSITVFNSGSYIVQVTSGQCSTKDTIQVSFYPRPIFSLGIDTVLCEGKNLILSPAVSGGTFLWQDGSTTPTYNVSTAGLYWLSYKINGCKFRDSIVVSYKATPPVNLGNDSSVCEGQTVLLQAGHSSVQSYLWQDGSTNAVYAASTNGTYIVTVTGFNGCVNRDTININVVPPPLFSLGSDTSICENSNIILTPFPKPTQATFLWSNNSTAESITTNAAGTYWLEASRQGCVYRDSIVVSINPVPTVQLGADTTLCEQTTLLLNAAVGNPSSYLWQDGSTGNNYLVTQKGTYWVRAKNSFGCMAIDTINVTYLPLPVITLGKDTLICPGQTITLAANVNTAVKYKWQDGSNFPSFSVRDTGYFSVTVQNICGTASNSIIIRKGICNLYIPNSFSPNGDNINDKFKINYPAAVKQFKMDIYNRYGQVVFNSTKNDVGWDGRFQSLAQPAGAYAWVISFIDVDGKNKVLKGTVLLLR